MFYDINNDTTKYSEKGTLFPFIHAFSIVINGILECFALNGKQNIGYITSHL
jgi:hypothetical protein